MARLCLPLIIIVWSSLAPDAVLANDPPPPSRPVWRPTGTTPTSPVTRAASSPISQVRYEEWSPSTPQTPTPQPPASAPATPVPDHITDPASVIPPGEVRMYTIEAMLARQHAVAVEKGRVSPAAAFQPQPAPAPPQEPVRAVAPAPPQEPVEPTAPALLPKPSEPAPPIHTPEPDNAGSPTSGPSTSPKTTSIPSPQRVTSPPPEALPVVPPAPDGPLNWTSCAPTSCSLDSCDGGLGCDGCPTGNSGFVFTPGNGCYPRIEIGGLLQIDAIWFQQDDSTRDVVGDVQDATDVRRARLHAEGDLAEDVSFKVEFDFGLVGRPNFMDTYVEFDDVPGLGAVRLGHWVQPFGLCAATSVRELLFLERGLPFIFMPFRQVGAGFKNSTEDERTLWGFSVYRFPTDVFAGSFGDSGYGLSGRVSRLLIDHAPVGRTLHVGGSYTANFPSSDEIRIATPPEVGFTQLDLSSGTPFPPYVDTGIISTHSYQLLGSELAGSWGPLLIQYEMVYAFLNQDEGPGLGFPGSSLEFAYVLTGETHAYRKKAGSYARVIPNRPLGSGGSGAWEIAGRCSHINLSDENIQGGKLTDFTFGLNWYINRFTKLQANYIHAILDRGTAEDGHSNIAAIRAQIDF